MTARAATRRKKLVLSGELNIYGVREAADVMLPKLRAAATPLDLADVSEIDSAGLQLLVMARRVAAAAGHEFDIAAASAAVREALDLVQCDELRRCLRGAA